MKNTINQTFQKKLLISPTPRCNEKEFWQLYDRMIGNKSDIIEFLETSETQKKYELSKKIIKRLVYESNFPPTMQLLDFLYSFESTVRFDRSVKHPSRDHYIHMCYLYFLGLYLFFYFPRFNRQLHDVLNLVRTSSGVNEEIGFVKNFISVWKYFVLYHDIAYPFEYFGNGEKDYNKIEKEKLEQLKELFAPKEIQKSIIEFASIRILSVYIAIYKTIRVNSQRTNVTFEYLNRLQQFYIENDNKKEFKDFLCELDKQELTFLKYVKTGDDIKYYLTVFSHSQFIILLKENSNIKYIITEAFFFAAKDVQDKELIYNIYRNKSILFGDELHLWIPKQYDIEYYGVDLEKSDVLKEFFEFEMLERIEFDVSPFFTMKDIVFESYLKCEEYIRPLPKQQNGLKEFEKICKKRLMEYWDDNYNNNKGSSDEEIGDEYDYAEKFINEYYAEIEKSKKEWNREDGKKYKLLQDVVTEYKKPYAIRRDSRDLYERILNKIHCEMGENWKQEDKKVLELYKTENYDNLLNLLDRKVKEYVGNSLRIAVQCDDNLEVTTILKDYKMDYTNYDHGISASAVYILHYHLYQQIIQRSKDIKWLRIGLGMPNIDDDKRLSQIIDEKYTSDYIGMVGQVAYAILVHNLYPSNFRDEKINGIKTSANLNPFAYFCMLCDALQNWGRPFNVNPIKESYPLFLDSLRVNIKLDDYINIKFEESNPGIIEQWLKPFTEELDKYLEGTASLIKVKFV